MPPKPQAPRTSPVPIVDLCRDRLQAIDAALDRLVDPDRDRTAIAVLGDRGLGKSMVTQAVAAEAAKRGMTVIALETGDDHQSPFATVLSGLPELAPDLVDAPETVSPAALGQLIGRAGPGGLLLLVDDAQDMDKDSARFLAHVHHTVHGDVHRSGHRTSDLGPAGTPVVAMAVAAPEADLLPAELGRAFFRSQRTTYLELEPLNQTDVAELVGAVFVEASAQLRRALTVDLMERSEGHPAVVDALLPLVNPSTYTLDLGPAPAPAAIESIIDDANRSAVHGAFRESVEKLGTLDRLPGISLNEATRTLLAVSLFRIGAHAEAERITDELVAEALETGDHRAALAAATLGLPEAERYEGSDARVMRLLRIDPAKLDQDDRFRHAVTTARQWMFTGHTAEAETWKQHADDLADTPDKTAAVKNVDWYLSSGIVAPEQQYAEVADLIDTPGMSMTWRVTLKEHLTISAYETGRMSLVDDTLAAVGRFAEEAGDNLRYWRYLSMKSMLAFDRGDWEEAERLRIRAVAHAQDHAIGDGEHLYLAQKFNEAWIKNEQAVFEPMLSKLPPEIGNSFFGLVAGVEAMRAAGKGDEAEATGRELVRRSTRYGGHRSLPALAYLSHFIREFLSEEDKQTVIGLLSKRAGTMLTYGLGASTFGPVDRYLFHISGHVEHLQRAIEVADLAGVGLWQVLLRAEYLAATGMDDGLLLRQIRGLSTDNSLSFFLDR